MARLLVVLPRVRVEPGTKMRHAVAASSFITVLLYIATTVHAQAPRFHRDCGTGQLLVNGSCQPIDAALAANGGRVYWVAQQQGGANDANPGTRDQPWRTMTRAAQALQPGDSVIVRAGTYREQVMPARGGTAANSRITYAAYTGETVIVSGAEVEWVGR